MLENAMEVLNLFDERRREIGVIEAANLLGRPKSTASRWLSAMHHAGFLDRDAESGRYRISLRLAAFGELARQASSLQQAAYPWLRQITAATGETSNLVIRVGSEASNVEAVESPRPVAHMGAVGRRFPLHASAGGKALMVDHEAEELRGLSSERLERRTEHTITKVEDLLRELARVREQGFAVNWQEMEEDLVGIGAPVRDHRSRVVAALTISAPVWRVSRDDLSRIGGVIRDAAEGLSVSLGWRSSSAG
jgi:DNA-binding IclR family transcriptional regulator